MITVIVVKERDPDTGADIEVVSHGIDEMGRMVVMPQDRPHEIGAVFDRQLGEYVLPDPPILSHESDQRPSTPTSRPRRFR